MPKILRKNCLTRWSSRGDGGACGPGPCGWRRRRRRRARCGGRRGAARAPPPGVARSGCGRRWGGAEHAVVRERGAIVETEAPGGRGRGAAAPLAAPAGGHQETRVHAADWLKERLATYRAPGGAPPSTRALAHCKGTSGGLADKSLPRWISCAIDRPGRHWSALLRCTLKLDLNFYVFFIVYVRLSALKCLLHVFIF